MKDKKKIIIGILCILVAIMAVGYAALATRLTISGTSSIDSTWKVEITNITEKDIVGDATSKEVPSYTATTANFSVGLIQPGDSITYDIEISNLGTLKAKVDSISVTMDENDAITYTTSGVKQGDKLGVGEKAILAVKVEYNSAVTSQPTNRGKELTVTINYVQDLENDVVTYDAYSIGDVVNFAGSNWYVIKNSTADQDYVTLLKEKVLTNTELGEYAYNATSDAMSYYWSDTCHPVGYGYTDSDDSGCAGHNDYEGSKVKEYLEGTYINTLGKTNLKEVDGYQVRLITIDELNKNLGWVNLDLTIRTDNENANVPMWIYEGYGSNHGQWTMSLSTQLSGPGWPAVWSIWNNKQLMYNAIFDIQSIRPVINLLKSSI